MKNKTFALSPPNLEKPPINKKPLSKQFESQLENKFDKKRFIKKTNSLVQSSLPFVPAEVEKECEFASPPTDSQKYIANTQTTEALTATKLGDKVDVPDGVLYKTQKFEHSRELYDYLHIRITAPLIMKDLFDWIAGICPRCIIAEEFGESNNLHFHIFAEVPLEFCRSREAKLRKSLQECFPEIKEMGNHSIAKSRDDDQLMKYVLKDGSFLVKGYPLEVIKKLESQSYKKISIQEYKRKVMDIRADYISDKTSCSETSLRLVQLRAEFGMTKCSCPLEIAKKLKDWYIQKSPDAQKQLAKCAVRMLDDYVYNDLNWDATNTRGDPEAYKYL